MPTSHLGFRTPTPIDIVRINRFFASFAANTARITFHRAANDLNVVILDLPDFWCANNLRRGFLTLFLRCAAVHYKDDIDLALKTYDLSASILPAVHRFMDGYTHLAGASLHVKGIVEHFKGKDETAVREMLSAYAESSCKAAQTSSISVSSTSIPF